MTRALAVGLLLATSIAAAEVVTLPNTKATLDVPATWSQTEVEGVVVGARGPGGEVLALTRAQVPNPDAWRSKKREAYADQIERGIAANVKGYKRLTRKLATVAGIPVLDLEAKRGDGATLLVRVILYRTYALALAIEVPRRRRLAEPRAIVTTFAPPSVTDRVEP